jgi:hypothetical protein
MTYHGLTGSIPSWTKERRLPGGFADQMAKSRWLRIQYVNHVFALTLTPTFSVVAGKPAKQQVHPALQPELPQIQATRLTLHCGGDDDACRGVGRAARRRAGRGVGPSARRGVGRHALYGASPAPPAWLEPKSWPAQPAPTKSVKMT